ESPTEDFLSCKRFHLRSNPYQTRQRCHPPAAALGRPETYFCPHLCRTPRLAPPGTTTKAPRVGIRCKRRAGGHARVDRPCSSIDAGSGTARGAMPPRSARSARAAQAIEPARKDPFDPRPGSRRLGWREPLVFGRGRKLDESSQTSPVRPKSLSSSRKVAISRCYRASLLYCVCTVAQRPHWTKRWGARRQPSRSLFAPHVSLQFRAE